jgi:RNA polymerase sigma factor (sigma-70 family)
MGTTDELLTLAEPVIVATIKRRLRGRLAELRDDIAQLARLHLWRHSLQRFDPSRGTFAAFVTTCVDQVIGRELRKAGHEPDGSEPELDPTAPGADPHVERLADQIRTDPEAYLTRTQARVFRLISVGADRQTIADQLGIEPNTVSQICWRMKKRLVELAA